ncbi:MAG: histidine kinase, partial [Caulobacteraceae bacterium]|nr:histidine kinase [Caulobacter sp.]
MRRRAAARGFSAPLSVQILLLMLGALVVAQGVTLGLTLLLPPPAPPQYRLEDIAAALAGREVKAQGGRPLVRTLRDAPPSLRSTGWLVSERSRHDLARLLNAPEGDVRLLFYSPLPFAGAGGGGLADAGGPAARPVRLAQAGEDWAARRVAFLEGPPGGGGGP